MGTKTTPIIAFVKAGHVRLIAESGERKTVDEYAEYLGISKSLLDKLQSGAREKIDDETAHKLAARLGPEVYDVFGMPRPDPLQRMVIENWGQLDPEMLTTISKWMELIAARKEGARTVEASATSTRRKSR